MIDGIYFTESTKARWTSAPHLSIVRLLENSSSMGFYYRKSVDLGPFRGEVLGNYEAEKDT